jgi:hypothetical protein
MHPCAHVESFLVWSVSTNTNTVRVKFVLEKECAFGQHFLLVGDDPALGFWDPAKATALEWSEGHVWTVSSCHAHHPP